MSSTENEQSSPIADNNGSDKTLGERKRIDSLNEFKAESERLFSSAQRVIRVYSKDLDPRVLNDRLIEKQFIEFIKRSRASKVELLIYDDAYLRGVDHRLVSLAQRFSSFVEIRLVPKDHHENFFGFYLADNKRIIHRHNIERYEAEYAELPNSLVKEKVKWFDEIWQQSPPASFLRALHL